MSIAVDALQDSGIWQAQELAKQLAQVLDLEFEALRIQDLEQFEQLQATKTELLAHLGQFAPGTVPQDNETRGGADWQAWRYAMADCRDQHRRNAVLIERQLDAVRGTLQSLRLPDSPSPIEMYNRLGHIARSVRGQGYSDA